MKWSKRLFILLMITLTHFIVVTKIVYSVKASPQTVDFILIIDISSSMYYPWIASDDIKNAVYDFVLDLPENAASVSLLTFNKSTFQDVFKMPVITPEERTSAADQVVDRLDRQYHQYKDQRAGTNIGGAMLAGARTLSVGGLDTPVVMVLFTDAYNSNSTKSEYPGIAQTMRQYSPEELIFYAVELRDKNYLAKYIDENELHVDLSEIAIPLGGDLYVAENVSQVGDCFKKVNNTLKLIGMSSGLDSASASALALSDEALPSPSAAQFLPEQPIPAQFLPEQSSPEDPLPSSQTYPVGILITTQDISKGLLEGNGLRVQGHLLNLNNNTIVSTESDYSAYEATLFIKKHTDEYFHESLMNPRPSSYNLTMTLPEYGFYEFYIQLCRADTDKTVIAESERQIVIVHNRIPLGGIWFVDTPSVLRREKNATEDWLLFNLTAQFIQGVSDNERYNDIYALYYDEYRAIAYINPRESKEYVISYVMQTDGESYYIEADLPGSGVYDYRVDIMNGDEVLISRTGTVTVIGPLYYLVSAAFFAIGVCCIVYTYILWFKRNYFDFIITLSGDEGVNQLTFATRMDCVGKCFSLKRLLRTDKKVTRIEPIGGKFSSIQEDLFEDFRNRLSKNPITFSATGKDNALTLHIKDKRILVKPANPINDNTKLYVKDSVTLLMRLNDRTPYTYAITLLYIKRDAGLFN